MSSDSEAARVRAFATKYSACIGGPAAVTRMVSTFSEARKRQPGLTANRFLGFAEDPSAGSAGPLVGTNPDGTVGLPDRTTIIDQLLQAAPTLALHRGWLGRLNSDQLGEFVAILSELCGPAATPAAVTEFEEPAGPGGSSTGVIKPKKPPTMTFAEELAALRRSNARLARKIPDVRRTKEQKRL